MAPLNHRLRWRTSNCSLLLIYRPREDERLSWPSWLTCSGRFTHIVVTRRLQAERRTGSVRRPKTGVLPTVLRNQPCHLLEGVTRGGPMSCSFVVCVDRGGMAERVRWSLVSVRGRRNGAVPVSTSKSLHQLSGRQNISDRTQRSRRSDITLTPFTRL